jgi:putative ABC transport system substrate-binding protein
MKRRELLGLIGGGAIWPRLARAQQPPVPVIGFLHMANPEPYESLLAEFRLGLKSEGYVEGQNVAIEYRWADNQGERLPMLAADLVERRVAVIVAAGGSRPALAAKAATSTIPIVLAFGSDPLQLGLLASLNRPGGNVTGVTFITAQLEPKRLEYLTEIVPQARTIGYLNLDPKISTTVAQQTNDMLAAARTFGRDLVIAEAGSNADFEPAFATFVQHGVQALMVATSPLFTSNRHKLLALAAQHRIPAAYHLREFVLDGGLMSYGANIAGAFRGAGTYVGQILKGAKPADLPVQRSTRFELVINLKTATALGLTVPPMMIAVADQVIE